jgi:dCMP deaminase
MPTVRPSLDHIMMELAHSIAKRSHDPKHRVGCVVTDQAREKVLAFGYNGGAKGQTNQRDSMEEGKSGFIHAEVNALVKCDYSVPNKVVFLTLSPCNVCAKLLVNAGVSEVYYSEVYDHRALEILTAGGIIHCQTL